MSVTRGSASTILAPRLAAFFIQVAATGWLAVGLEPITKISSACSTSLTGLLTAPEPTPSSSAATLDAWHRPGAVVHVVAAKAGAHQLLEQVGLFVAALGRAKARQRLGAVRVAQAFERASGQVQRLVPGRFAEGIAPVGTVGPHLLGHTGFADQRHREAVGMVRVVKAKPALHAQAAVVGGAVAAFHADDLFIAHVVGDEAAHTAERADRIDFAVAPFASRCASWG